MDTITVRKEDLLDTIRRNRDEHRDIFQRAQEAYREKWIEELDVRLREAQRGYVIRRHFSLPEPEDHTRDFDTAIQMLEWETGDEVELDRRDFQRYVQNQWEWAQSFGANTRSYVEG